MIEVNKQNNIYHRKIKMKSFDVNLNIYIGFNKKNNVEDYIFKVGNHVRISRYKNILTKVPKKCL